METLHWFLVIVAILILAFVGYSKWGSPITKEIKESARITGKAQIEMPIPPRDEIEEEIISLYVDSPEDIMTYYEDPELEFGISQEEFDALVQKEIERREYKVKKIDRNRYMNEDKARKISDLTRNQLETITMKQMQKKKSVIEDFYQNKNYSDLRQYDRFAGNKHQISMLEGQELSRPYASTIEF